MIQNILRNDFYSIGIVFCGPTLYEVDENLGEANPVMIPVSSTAIPLDDLPVFKVIIDKGYLYETYCIIIGLGITIFMTYVCCIFLGWIRLRVIWKR